MKKHITKNIILLVLLLLIFLTPLSFRQGHTDGVNVYFDLIVDDSRRRVYGANTTDGTVDVISIDTLELITTVDLGGEPRGIDIDPSGSELAVTIYSLGEIAFINLDTLNVIERVMPNGASPNRPIDVLYGRNGRLYSVGDGGSGIDYIHIFDSGTKSEIGNSSDIVRGKPRIAITEDHNSLFVSEHFSPNKLYRYDVTTDSITQTHSSPHGPVHSSVITISPDGERIYTSLGQIWSGDLSEPLGYFNISDGITSLIVDTDIGFAHAEGRVFLSIVQEDNTSLLIEYDAESFHRLRVYNFDYPIKAPRPNENGTRIYISTPEGIQSFSAMLETAAYLPISFNNYCSDFFDNFSNPTSGWPVGEDSIVKVEYLGGEYRILSKQDGYLNLLRAPACAREIYTVEVDARWQGAPGSSYGILFGITNNFSSYYLFDINTDYQQFRLYRRDSNGFTQIVAPTYSSAINTGTATNHLGVTRNANQITLSMNGIVLGMWWDNQITGSTSVGLVSSPYNGSPTSDSRFDNFSVINLPSSSVGTISAGKINSDAHESFDSEIGIEPRPPDW